MRRSASILREPPRAANESGGCATRRVRLDATCDPSEDRVFKNTWSMLLLHVAAGSTERMSRRPPVKAIAARA